MREYSTEDPIYALATAYAPSALAITRLSGRGSHSLLAKAFSSPGRIEAASDKSLVHGYITASDGSRIDEVVVALYKVGSGYTGEEAAEISTHGSLVVLSRLFKRLEELGFKAALKGEFTFRAFMHGRMDLTQAEAVEELVHSRSDLARANALERLSGRLGQQLSAIRTRLVDMLASLEVHLDYGEDEILEDWVFPTTEVDGIISRLRLLASTYSASRIWREGAVVVLAGQANAGKSSLFNYLVKEDRAIVSSIPGTTRDFIEAWTDFRGMPVHLYDTAGLREGAGEVEDEGIRRARKLIDEADLIVQLVEPGEEAVPVRPEATIIVRSKSDLSQSGDGLSVSSVTGEGVADLVDAIYSRLMKGAAIEGGSLVIDSERQRDALLRCAAALEEAKAASGAGADVLALFFQAALEELSSITGELTNEELLDHLFENFCLGK